MCSRLSFECVLSLLLLLLPRSLEEVTTVELGQNAQLPCTYRLPTSGHLVPVCWGRGACPLLDCHSVLLRTNGSSVTYRLSGRYMLQRHLYNGDVTLTIMNVAVSDSGTYCCRIQFPGIMNDDKVNRDLVITPAKVTPAPTVQRDGKLTTKGHGPETQTPRTHQEKNQTQTFTLAEEFQDSGAKKRKGVYIGVGVFFGVALVFISGALILLCYSHRKENLQNASLITLANLPPSGLANAVAEGTRSEGNIYIIEENAYTTTENIYATEEHVYTMEEHVYSAEENVYEVEDPSDHYCSVVRA